MEELRALIFDLAGLLDDGSRTLTTAFRHAARAHHPDHGGASETFRRLLDARERFRAAGLWI